MEELRPKYGSIRSQIRGLLSRNMTVLDPKYGGIRP